MAHQNQLSVEEKQTRKWKVKSEKQEAESQGFLVYATRFNIKLKGNREKN